MPDGFENNIPAPTGQAKLAKTKHTDQLAQSLLGMRPVLPSGEADQFCGQPWVAIGIIVREGPEGREDFQNNQYWVMPQFIRPGNTISLIETSDAPKVFSVTPIPVTNLWEQPLRRDPADLSLGSTSDVAATVGPHLLRAGKTVVVHAMQDDRKLRFFISVPPDPLYIKITSATPIPSTTNRWQYGWIEMEYTRDGKWQEVPGGLTHVTAGESSGSGGAAYAYNRLEANNAATGVQGNGYDLTYLAASMVFYPIRGSGIFKADAVVTCEGKLQYSIEAVNAIQGNCP